MLEDNNGKRTYDYKKNLFFCRIAELSSKHCSLSEARHFTLNTRIDALYQMILELEDHLLGYSGYRLKYSEVAFLEVSPAFKYHRIKEFESESHKQGLSSYVAVQLLEQPNKKSNRHSLRIIGYSDVQRASNAHRLLVTPHFQQTNPIESVVVSSTDSISGSCLLGINKLWVTPDYRRRGVATQIIDFIRQNLVYGYHIPRNACCYHQPTVDGRRFAECYSYGKGVFIYDPRWH